MQICDGFSNLGERSDYTSVPNFGEDAGEKKALAMVQHVFSNASSINRTTWHGSILSFGEFWGAPWCQMDEATKVA